MSRRGFRLQYMFWLNLDKPDQASIAAIIEDLKEARSFAKTIRDGIRLITSLQRGDTSVLLELFPLLQLGQHTNATFTGNRIENVNIFAEHVEHVDPTQARENFASGFGDLFADDDDLWD